MQDLFSIYEYCYREYKSKKDMLDRVEMYHFEILSGLYKNVLELKPGNDLMCLDYMDFSEYTKMVSKQHAKIVREVQEYINGLERDLIKLKNYFESTCRLLNLYGGLTFGDFLELLDLFEIKYTYVIHDGIYDQEGITIHILETGEVFTFWGNGVFFVTVDDDIVINPMVEYLLGTDFVRFYINYLYNNGFCRSIQEIYKAYKLEENKLV